MFARQSVPFSGDPAGLLESIRGLGNRLRHAYDSIDAGLIWMIVEKDLLPLKTAAEAALQKLRESR